MLSSFVFPVQGHTPYSLLVAMAREVQSMQPQHIYLLHVGSPSAQQVRRLQRLEEGMQELGLPVEFMQKSGHVATEVVATAKATDSVICFARQPRNPVRKALAGSVVSDVLRMSEQPVLIHKRNLSLTDDSRIRTVMYATDFKYKDSACIRYIKQQHLPAQNLVLLHVGERAPDPEAEKRRYQTVVANLERLASECRDSYEHIEQLEVVGLGVDRQIIRQARRHNVDLLMLGCRLVGSGFFNRFVGSTAQSLQYRAPCSLLIIPSVSPQGEENNG